MDKLTIAGAVLEKYNIWGKWPHQIEAASGYCRRRRVGGVWGSTYVSPPQPLRGPGSAVSSPAESGRSLGRKRILKATERSFCTYVTMI